MHIFSIESTKGIKIYKPDKHISQFHICSNVFFLFSDRFSHWSRNEHLTNYLSTRNEIYTLNSSSKLMCVNECTKTANCVSVFYIEKSCRLNNVYFTTKAELVQKSGSEYIASGNLYIYIFLMHNNFTNQITPKQRQKDREVLSINQTV